MKEKNQLRLTCITATPMSIWMSLDLLINWLSFLIVPILLVVIIILLILRKMNRKKFLTKGSKIILLLMVFFLGLNILQYSIVSITGREGILTYISEGFQSKTDQPQTIRLKDGSIAPNITIGGCGD